MLKVEGIYAAVITPYDTDHRASRDQLLRVLKHLKDGGAHGVLLTGTNGEGPQLSAEERITLYKAVGQSSVADETFSVIAGTGAVSLADTIKITRGAYEAGLSAACVLPPFFFGDVSEDGLFEFYSRTISEAVPSDAPFLLYNNPKVIAVQLTLSLISRLREAFPRQIVGIKDSSGDAAFFNQLRTLFPDLQIMVGSDTLLEHALTNGGSGSITGSANAFSPELRELYDAHKAGEPIRSLYNAHIERMQPLRTFPMIAMYKSILAARGVISNVAVRPPLQSLSARQETELFELVRSVTV